jgi:beta-aspartyl-peptidase (threonine type)
MSWALILHGGAKDIAPEQEEANRTGCLDALACGRRVLEGGGTAVAAVEAAIRALEDDPTFNAGYGSVLNADGEVETDAALMDGASLALGGVGALAGVRNPITVARLMLGAVPTLLVGEGARRFAQEHGAELCDPKDLISPEQKTSEATRGRDTVGCVALDQDGDLAAGTSTGGLTGKLQGRVGDSPLPGCGLYADNLLGGVSVSGDGEMVSRITLAAHVMRGLETGAPQEAADLGLARLQRVGGEAGAIVLGRDGRIGWVHNSRHFAVAFATGGEPPAVFLNRHDMKQASA